jgi:pyruvate dehydrogenase E1 component beta subunit
LPDAEYTIPLGKARIAREGKDVTVIAWGSMLHRTLQAVEGFDAEVIDLMTLNPFDEEAVLQSAKKTGRVVVVHEAPATCGLGAEISATIAEHAMLHLKAPIVRVTGYDVVLPLPKLEDYYLPSIEKIRKGIETVLKY